MTALPVADDLTTADVPTATRERLAVAACLFHGFSDPSRIAILRHLRGGEHRVRDLTAHLGLAQSTVSKHLACLKDCGLVTSRPQGRASVYTLTHPQALDALFTSAQQLLDLTGEAIALCENHGVTALGQQGVPAPGHADVTEQSAGSR